jgi:hypothetical protein
MLWMLAACLERDSELPVDAPPPNMEEVVTGV